MQRACRRWSPSDRLRTVVRPAALRRSATALPNWRLSRPSPIAIGWACPDGWEAGSCIILQLKKEHLMAEVTIEVRPNGLIPEPLPPDAPADFRLEIIAAVEGALPTGTSSGVPTREIVMSPRSVVRSSVSDIASCARSRAIFLRSRHRAAARHVPEGCLGRVCASHPGDDAGSARSARRPHPRAFSASEPCCGRTVPAAMLS